ncbi:alpha/beta hydrolase [Saccharopolyspora sp. ID03-671]|uniref:alpha/beta fold hydrolase n=1 Tax=Saccharopolyspora sp. ID03-671 TaxID=3073066 RepID=UPI003252C513
MSEVVGRSDEPEGIDRPSDRVRRVVALPGTFCAPMVFDPLRELVEPRFDVRALPWMTEAPECGIDEVAEWVAGMISSSASGSAIVVGHSTGGAVALRLAAERPELVEGLMLVNTGPNMHRHGDVTSLIDGMERDGTEQVVRAVIERSFHHSPSDEDRRRLLDYGDSVPLIAALQALRSQHATDLEPVLPDLPMPVSIVHGRFDPVRTVDVAEGMAAAIPDASLRIVDAGHSPTYETPDAVAEALVALERRSGPVRGADGATGRGRVRR